MHSLLYFPLQDPRSCGLIIIGDFEDVGGIYIVIVASAHDMVSFDVKLEDWNLEVALSAT